MLLVDSVAQCTMPLYTGTPDGKVTRLTGAGDFLSG